MGVHAGTPRLIKDAMTRRMEYMGSVVNAAARMTALTHGGQVMVSEQARAKLRMEASNSSMLNEASLPELMNLKRLSKVGRFELPDTPGGTDDPSILHRVWRMWREACVAVSNSLWWLRRHESVRAQSAGSGEPLLWRSVAAKGRRRQQRRQLRRRWLCTFCPLPSPLKQSSVVFPR
jgi:hypothetical protein